MILIKTAAHLTLELDRYRKEGKAPGFVPTMGALHAGHISLVKQCRVETGCCVVSIFVNPTQFNNPADFDKYPVTIEKDIELLEAAGCDVLFLPAVDEIYPPGFEAPHYELGYLETILEGKFRPGHFQGVCMVVDRLLAMVQPAALYMGSKDYQQCMVIKKFLELRNYPTVLHVCPTVREKDGLAMSSRNVRLNATERQTALEISKVLYYIKENIQPGYLEDLKLRMTNHLEQAGFRVDYVEIADAAHLQPQEEWDGKTPLVALVAAFINEVRLIDNMEL